MPYDLPNDEAGFSAEREFAFVARGTGQDKAGRARVVNHARALFGHHAGKPAFGDRGDGLSAVVVFVHEEEGKSDVG